MLKGTDIQLGVGRESTRGTYQAPSLWVPGRAPVSIHRVVDKAQIRETTGNSLPSTGAVVVQKRTEGEFEHNVRSSSVGYFLLSLMGKVTTTEISATEAYQHVLELLAGNPQYPTLSLALSQLGEQDYKFLRTLVTAWELTIPVDDLVYANASFMGTDEQTQSDYTPALPDDDYFFRPQDVTVKMAANVAGLGAAQAMKLKELSLSIANAGRVNQNISEVLPGDVIALAHEITGSFAIDYNDETIHDAYAAGDYKAFQITLERTDIDLDGEGAHPKIDIVLPRVTFESYDPDRPIDDIVTEPVDFTAHYDETEGYGIQVTVVNAHTAYTT